MYSLLELQTISYLSPIEIRKTQTEGRNETNVSCVENSEVLLFFHLLSQGSSRIYPLTAKQSVHFFVYVTTMSTLHEPTLNPKLHEEMELDMCLYVFGSVRMQTESDWHDSS